MVDKEEVLKIGSGRKMDFLVEQEVLGNDTSPEIFLKHSREIPHYSTNIYSAEKILEKTKKRYPIILQGATSWECKVFLPTGKVVSSGSTESLSLAVCRAALLTVIEKERQDRIKEPTDKKKSGISMRQDPNKQEKHKKQSKLLFSIGSFFYYRINSIRVLEYLFSKINKNIREREKRLKES